MSEYETIEEGIGSSVLDVLLDMGETEGFFYIGITDDGTYEVRGTFVAEIQELIRQ